MEKSRTKLSTLNFLHNIKIKIHRKNGKVDSIKISSKNLTRNTKTKNNYSHNKRELHFSKHHLTLFDFNCFALNIIGYLNFRISFPVNF
jgi:hypothetical protein